MSINIEFEALAHDQQTKVRSAYGTRERQCSGCAVYIGKTSAGEHTYFWHYGVSEGYVVLPVGSTAPFFNYESGTVWIGDREFTTDGQEVLPPPFEYLVHFDIRKWHNLYKERVANGGFASTEEEAAFLDCCGCNNRSAAPKRVAEKLGIQPNTEVVWLGHAWLKPWELTQDFYGACLAITIVLQNGDKIDVL